MAKAFDASKFRKSITKAVPGMSVGFRDPDTWISTGNYCLNKLISNDFHKGIPLGKVTVLAGESGAGKSYIASGNIVRNAQQQGIFVVLIDSENALDQSWLHALDVSTDDDKLLKLNVAMIDDVARIISDFMADYRKEYTDVADEERPKVLFVLDSLGMMMTPTDVNQFEKGDMKGDMGRKPKALAALVRNCVNMFGDFNVGMIATNHTYASQDMFDPDDKISGGQGFIYASSIVIAMRKLKLKTDADGNKTSQVHGIRAACKVVKTRYSKPFETVQVEIPYETGMSPYSGLIEFFEAKGLLTKQGNRLRYITKAGEEILEFRKKWTDDKLDIVIADWNNEDIDSEKHGLESKEVDSNGDIVDENSELNEA
jgi:recombination protein RecA|tara:strand:+ start:7291 stop:8403 length:1113 start_codon:yes stop_codon:yes gene_type:complete